MRVQTEPQPRRDHLVAARVTATEFEDVRRRARVGGLSVSEFVRSRCLPAAQGPKHGGAAEARATVAQGVATARRTAP